jgi:integrase
MAHSMPYPITWEEQDALFRRLPLRMALFAIHTGLRDSNVCGLQWDWEVAVPEVGQSVFVIPPEAFKTKRPHVVVLNDVVSSIIKSQRGKHPLWVFPYRGRRIGKVNNKGWQQARYEAGLPLVRVHDLRHSFAAFPAIRRSRGDPMSPAPAVDRVSGDEQRISFASLARAASLGLMRSKRCGQ